MANYLYNGVELPAWPATHHPYMAIFRHRDDSTKYRLWFSEDGIVYNDDGNARFEMQGHSVLYNLEENKWVKFSEYPSGGITSVFDTALYPIFWASHDVLRQNGDVYFESVPAINAETGEEVYYYPTTEPIDPTSFMQCYFVGQRLAGMRNKTK